MQCLLFYGGTIFSHCLLRIHPVASPISGLLFRFYRSGLVWVFFSPKTCGGVWVEEDNVEGFPPPSASEDVWVEEE